MQIPVQIVMRNLHRSEALEGKVQEKIAKLEKFCSSVVSCRVTVEQMHRHQSHGRHYGVRVDLRIPGKIIEINREHDQDVFVALRDAFLAAARQLEAENGKRSDFVVPKGAAEEIGEADSNHVIGPG